MSTESFWSPFRIQEPGCSTVVCGHNASHDEAMKVREKMKVQSAMNKYVGIPFVAKDKEEAERRAYLF